MLQVGSYTGFREIVKYQELDRSLSTPFLDYPNVFNKLDLRP